MNKLLMIMLGLTAAGAAVAKLPPVSPEAQAKADEARQKTAWTDKVAAYQLCKAQDKLAAAYRQKKGGDAAPAAPATASAASTPAPAAPADAAGQSAPPAVAAAPTVPPCQDPGPYVAATDAAKVGVADSLPVPAAGKPPTPAEAKK